MIVRVPLLQVHLAFTGATWENRNRDGSLLRNGNVEQRIFLMRYPILQTLHGLENMKTKDEILFQILGIVSQFEDRPRTQLPRKHTCSPHSKALRMNTCVPLRAGFPGRGRLQTRRELRSQWPTDLRLRTWQREL